MKWKRMFAVEGPDGGWSVEINGHLVLGRDVKLVKGQRNVSSSVIIPEPKFVFKDSSRTRPLDPVETIRESERILDVIQRVDVNPLTVGDLSGLKERKRREDMVWIRKSVNTDEAVTVGDLTVLESSGKGLGDLYQGPRSSDVRPSVSESQAIETERYRRHREQLAEQQRLRSVMTGGRDECLDEYVDRYFKAKLEPKNGSLKEFEKSNGDHD